MLSLAVRKQKKVLPLLKASNALSHRYQHYSVASKQIKVTLDGGTLYIDQDAAKALGWTQDTPPEGVSLRLSGWGPHYFAITQTGTDADSLAYRTVESSQNKLVQATLEHLKKTDSE